MRFRAVTSDGGYDGQRCLDAFRPVQAFHLGNAPDTEISCHSDQKLGQYLFLRRSNVTLDSIEPQGTNHVASIVRFHKHFDGPWDPFLPMETTSGWIPTGECDERIGGVG